MMPLPVIILPAATLDIVDTIQYYNHARPGHGELFRLELDRTLSIIARWPHGYELITRRLRRAVVRHSSHAVIYRPLSDAVRVVGVISTYRDPAFVPTLDLFP